ncbi:MAG: TetR/AcrR family transcriptional regulator [Cellvibrionaceae bacterium]
MSTLEAPLVPKTPRGQRTRQKLLDAAEEEFGLNGFNQTSVSNITKNAGVGQGTFYLYFNSKEEILRELVDQLGTKLREAIAEKIAHEVDQESIEREGLRAFLTFVAEHSRFYRVISESQFVDEKIFEDYYMGFGAAYKNRLAKAERHGTIRPGDSEVRAWALMGVAQFLGQRFVAWAKPGESIDHVVDEAISILKQGFLE